MDKKYTEYTVDIDLYRKGYSSIKTLRCVNTFDTFKESLSFAKEYAKNKKNFKRGWLKESDADEIQLTIRHNYEFDENGNPKDWDDEECIIVTF